MIKTEPAKALPTQIKQEDPQGMTLTGHILAGLALFFGGLVVFSFLLDLVALPVRVWTTGPLSLLLLVGTGGYIWQKRLVNPQKLSWRRLDWAEAGVFWLVILGVLGYLLWLGRPGLLPVGTTVDAVHQYGLAQYIRDSGKLPIHALELRANLQDGLEYPPAFVTLVAVLAGAFRANVIYLLYPLAALSVALTCGTTFALASLLLQNRPWRLPLASLAVGFSFIAYGYTFGSITNQNYFAMVLAEWLLLVTLYFLVLWQRQPASVFAFLFGLTLATLLITYPTWALVPAATFGLITLFQSKPALRFWKAANPARLRQLVAVLLPVTLLAYLFLKDRLKTGLGTVANEGEVLLPDLSRYGWPIIGLAGLGLLFTAWGRGRALRFEPGRLLLRYIGLLAGEGLAFYLLKNIFGQGSYYSIYKLFYPATFLIALLAIAGLNGLFTLSTSAIANLLKNRLKLKHRRAISPFLSMLIVGLGLGANWLAHPEPERAFAVITPDMVKVGRWIEQNQEQPQNLKIGQYSVGYGLSPGTPAYWMQVGFFKQPQGNQAKLLLTGEPLSFEQWFYNAESEQYFLTDKLNRVNLDERLKILYQSGPVAVLTRTPAYKEERNQRQSMTLRYKAELDGERIKLTAEASFSPEPSRWTGLRLVVEPEAGGLAVAEQTTIAEPDRERKEYMGLTFEVPSLKPIEIYTNGLFPPVKYFNPLVPGRYIAYLELQKQQVTVERRKLFGFNYESGNKVLFDPAQRIQQGQFLFDGSLTPTLTLPPNRLDFGPDAPQLASYEVKGEAKAGETAQIALNWFNPASLTKNYQVGLVLLDSDGRSAAESESVPLNGLFPTWFWPANQPVSYLQSLKLPPKAGRYTLALSLKDLATNQKTTLQKLDKPLEVG